MYVLVNSRLHKCFHEAGHVEAAYVWGATVQSVKVDQSGNPRATILHKEDLTTKQPVACGGYAAESLLFRAGRLIDQSGSPISEPTFRRQAMQNARLDKFPFYITQPFDRISGIYPGSPYQPKGESWPGDSDDPFIYYAETKIAPVLKDRFATIEKLALELHRYGQLDRNEVENLRAE